MTETDEQRALRDLARDLFAAVSPPKRLRALWDGEPDGREVWRRLAASGLTGLAVPDHHGGAGVGFAELAVVLDEAGYAALPEPLLETAAVVGPLLADVGGPVADAWLPGIASGEAVATVQLDPAPYVVGAASADLVVREIDGALHAFEAEAVDVTPVVSEDPTRRLGTVAADAVPTTMLTDDAVLITRARTRAEVGTAALLVGIARRLLDTSVDYARTRHQFGQPIGAFQAIQHALADVHVELTSARGAVGHAAARLDAAPDEATHAASVAKVAANDAAHLANTVALQVHAGIGFTWEHDLHLWLKRGRALEQAYGSSRDHRRRLAAHLIDEESA